MKPPFLPVKPPFLPVNPPFSSTLATAMAHGASRRAAEARRTGMRRARGTWAKPDGRGTCGINQWDILGSSFLIIASQQHGNMFKKKLEVLYGFMGKSWEYMGIPSGNLVHSY